MQTKEDLLKWKMKRKYGHRWIAETAFSTIKRMFGEYVSVTRFQNIVNEVMVKVPFIICLGESGAKKGYIKDKELGDKA